MKFRKKPVVIDAVRHRGMGEFSDIPDWLKTALDDESVRRHLVHRDKVQVVTLEGTMTADPGDWIIRGVQGELYPCKPPIFEEIYEPVQDHAG